MKTNSTILSLRVCAGCCVALPCVALRLLCSPLRCIALAVLCGALRCSARVLLRSQFTADSGRAAEETEVHSTRRASTATCFGGSRSALRRRSVAPRCADVIKQWRGQKRSSHHGIQTTTRRCFYCTLQKTTSTSFARHWWREGQAREQTQVQAHASCCGFLLMLL